MPGIQKAKCFKFTVKILPPALGEGWGGAKNDYGLRNNAPPRFISVYTLEYMANETLLSWFFIKEKLPSEVPFSICHETTVLDKVLKCLSVTLFRGKH